MAEHVCPVWVGYFLACPLRKLFQNPKKILGPYVSDGMNVLDIGCAMGFFSIPLAEMVGPGGKVICIDVQEEMLASLQKRAQKAKVSDNIEVRVCSPGSLGLDGLSDQIDFALASAVVHEVPSAKSFFSEIYGAIKPSGRSLVVEPKGHVSQEDFEVTVSHADQAGFRVIARPKVRRSRTVLLEK